MDDSQKLGESLKYVTGRQDILSLVIPLCVSAMSS